ncbi:MAG: T9SS type A sorting domain-containing protein [Bacteroidetes bacterium]|nr:T9SS type A sorting domain-containing protein [Bacteroidota bacterium]
MRSFYIFSLICFWTHLAIAQVTFQRSISGTLHYQGAAVQQTVDGGYVIVGASDDCALCYQDVFVAKADEYGDLIWRKSFGDTMSDVGRAIWQTIDGGYIVAGKTYSFGAAVLGAGFADVFLMKLDAQGDIDWCSMMGGANFDGAESIQQTRDGGYIVGCNTLSFGAGVYEIMLIKLDQLGHIVWTRTLGDTGHDFLSAVRQTDDGGYIISGSTSSFTPPLEDVALIKTDSLGYPVWVKTYGGSDYEKAYGLDITMDGGYIMSGWTVSFGGAYAEMYVIKTDASGDTLWTKIYGGGSGDYAYNIRQTPDSGYAIEGSTESFGAHTSGCLLRIDKTGVPMWARAYGGTSFHDHIYGFDPTSDGGFVMVGNNGLSFSNPSTNMYFIKTDLLGATGCNEFTYTPTTFVPHSNMNTRTFQIESPVLTVTKILPTITSYGSAVPFCFNGLEDLSEHHPVQVFPNPGTGEFHLKFQDEVVGGYITITNLLGETVFQNKIDRGMDATIHLDNVVPGMYILQLSGSGTLFTQKILLTQQ